jgi:hypothetical protein
LCGFFFKKIFQFQSTRTFKLFPDKPLYKLVAPSLSGKLISKPCFMKNSTTSKWPLSAAA